MADGQSQIILEPQIGPQTDFLSTSADIALYGGAAGGGKSWALEFEPLRHFDVRGFGGVIFRRNTVQIRNKGGLWDQSKDIYGQLGARPREANLEWVFTSGMTMKFAHLEYDNTVFDWQGSEIPYIGFDELTHFTRKQFFYMLSRNRSTCGVRPYIRATCNPDPDSFVRELVDWWIDKDGWPILKRSGILRWFINRDDTLYWESDPEKLVKRFGPKTKPLSFTFIPARLEDNQILMTKDPGYEAKLDALSKVDRERLRYGNWNIRPSSGTFFRREWFPIVDEVPAGWIAVGRYWDRAATRPSPKNQNPDWTRGAKIYLYPNGKVLIADMKSVQGSAGQVEDLIKNVASHDGKGVRIKAYQDPGSAGVKEAEDFMEMLKGFDVSVESVSDKKALRAKPLARQAEFHNVMVLRGDWNEDLFKELDAFSENPKEYDHDDQVDSLSLGYDDLAFNTHGFDPSALKRLASIMKGPANG